MVIKSLSVENFMGYRKRCSLDFSGKPLVVITGRNGAGKSALLQAIGYALYGRTRAEREAQLINSHSKGALMVELDVTLHDGTDLHIERGRTLKNDPILKVSGLHGKAASLNSQLLEKLSLHYEDFISLSYFMQGDIHQFLHGNKQEYFQRWTSNLKFWSDREILARDKCVDFEYELKGIEDQRKRLNEIIKDEQSVRQGLLQARSEQESAQEDYNSVLDSVRYLSGIVRDSEPSSGTNKLVDSITSEMKNLDETISHFKEEEKRIRKSLSKLMDGTCPMLGRKCKGLQEVADKQKSSQEKRLRRLLSRSKKLISRKLQLGVKLALIIKRSHEHQIELAGNKLQEAKASASKLERKLHATIEKLALAKQRLQEFEDASRNLKSFDRLRDKCRANLRRWQFMKYMCSKAGVPSLLIDSSLQSIEEKCNWVLDRLEYPKRIKFLGYKELVEYEPLCPMCGSDKWRHQGSKQTCFSCKTERPRKRRTEPTIVIMDGTAERPFALESGGSQVLLSFATRLACSLFLASMTGIPMQLVMLDEIFAMLDSNNRRRLLLLVMDKLAGEFGLSQQLIVSHHEEVAGSVDHMLVVSNDLSGSRAEWV